MATVSADSITPEILLARLADVSGPVATVGRPGGFKKTFLATWRSQQVAIQVHFQSDPQRLPRESEALRNVSSDHVAKLLHETTIPHEGENLPVFICEFIDGKTIQEAVEEEGRLTGPDVMGLGIDVAKGLVAIHEQPLVHRDIKPSNVMRERCGVGKILDLGIAKHLDKDTITPGRHPGTVGWMAPEQFNGDLPVDKRCDLFGLGLVLFYAASGEHAYHGETREVRQESILHDTPRLELLSGQPQFASLIERFLEKKPYNRPRTAKIALAELEGLAA